MDNIRQIRDEVEYSPAEGKFRVYIIDEVHMLSTGAFNALLKTLEEPPPYVIFILATTEAHRIPITVLSRCQRYDFRRIDGATIAARLKEMAQAEGIEAEDKALRYIAKKGDGSLRDSISLFDQCAAFYYGETLTYERVLEVLGAVDNEVYSRFLRLLLDKDVGGCLRQVEELILSGRDLSQFTADFVWYLRGILLARTGEASEELLDMGGEDRARLLEDAKQASEETAMRYIRVLSETLNQMRYGSGKRVLLEITLIKLTRPAMETNLDSVLQRLADLEEKMAAAEAPALEQLAEKLVSSGLLAGAVPAAAQTGAPPEQAAGTEKEPVVVELPAAEFEQLQLLERDWADILDAVGLTAKTTLKDVKLEPQGEGRLLMVFHDPQAFDMGSRESVRRSLENYIASAYQTQVRLEARLTAREDYVGKRFRSKEELEDKVKQVMNIDEIIVE